MSVLTIFIQKAIVQGICILYGALGEIMTEKSGNLNLGIPGIMYMGGIAGLMGAFLYEKDNPNPNAAYPRLGITSADTSNNTQPSSYWMRNGNFLRFKSLEVGYRFPYCRVYFSGDNLAVFSPFKLWDPELSWNAYPLQRTFNLGVQFTF